MIEFPRVVYRSRTDYKRVNGIDEMEKLAEEGYGPFEIVVLGQKPAAVEAPKAEAVRAEVKDDLGDLLGEDKPVPKMKRRSAKRTRK